MLLKEASLPPCQQLHFLQMACEKLCKAHLYASGSQPDDLQHSHGYIGTVLPVIFRMRFSQAFDRELKNKAWLLQRVGHLAREINFLAPAVDDGGRRPDNCEYPWEEGGALFVPAEKQFTNLDFLKAQAGTLFVKLVDVAIEELCTPPPAPPSGV
ncbi:MAG: hypothetical protein NTW87_25715 [Planctomycetota bacterium]|nr:hypothetical protein [Planctomycetota bacterium]